MDYDADSDSDSGSIFTDYPFSWILVPLVIFAVVGMLLVCYRYRRQQKLRMRYGTNALERDLEAMAHHPRPRPGRPAVERYHAPGRWGFGFGTRDEGLNELGEAPPAYTAPQKRPDDAEGVELSPMPRQPAGTTAMGGPGINAPPTYDEIERGSDRSQSAAPPPPSNLPAPPPRAVLSPN
ncbi:hypothetical protein GGS23DRAFT_582732 [Durotheca rogersii]|uniref:uncharacterized protein n=1 Tax=Durotheca rogersii TaxID=419775 RepID=UPI00221F5FEF|nr:uncharacterized protein GGS23DRAFT_582732 [Durotheca rogersii]KAI5860141.1 hypothetical protein GGS23DRAFT_582732 [Durotheca rogersii]